MALSNTDMKTLKELFNKMDSSDLSLVADMHRYASSNIQQSVANQFRISDEVQFSSKRGPIKGHITKINRKTIKVKSDMGVWVVSPSLLKKV